MPCRFSVIIPTRNRERTLESTLQTCIAQEFDDYEILVSDNSTTTATRELIDRLNAPKIRYVRPPQPLSMSDHWDFAVSQAAGEFITIIGSDDGLMLHTLPELDRLIRQLGAQILHWTPACYNWPDLPVQPFGQPNELLIPTRQTDWYLPIHRRDSRAMILDGANSVVPYSELPMVYCSVVHRSLFDELRRKTGGTFRSRCPDIYSSFAFAHLAGFYYSLDAPMSINGLSGDSNGVAQIFLKEKSPLSDDFRTLNDRAKLLCHPTVPNLPVIPALTADSFLLVKELLFANDDTLTFDRRRMIVNSLRELRCTEDEEWATALQIVRASLKDDADLQHWFEAEVGRKKREEFEFAPHPQLKRYGQTYLHLDASEFGAANVMDAARLCEKVLGFKHDGVNAHLKPAAKQQPSDSGSLSAESLSHLQETEAALAAAETEIAQLRRTIEFLQGGE